MKCTECGTKCVLVETVTEPEPGADLKHYECPECCNCFAKPAKAKKTKVPR